MSLLNVIDRIEQHEPDPFIAPLPDAEQVEVFTVLDDIPYRFRLRDAEPGWWILRSSKNKKRARIERAAYPYEYVGYLSQLPRFYVIACFRIAAQTWLCVPYNAADAVQRGWQNGEPRQLHIVREAIQSFDIISSRSLAGTLLYDQVATRVTGGYHKSASYRVAKSIVEQQRKQLEAEARQKALAEQRQTLHGKLRYDLEFVGAKLVDIEEAGEHLEVTWEYDGHRHTATVQRNGRIESAGICLGHANDSHSRHNLASLVGVIQEARKLHRFDMPEESWI